MEPANAIAIWRGRWILTGGLILLALVGVGVAMVFLPRTYQSTASVLLLDSRYGAQATGGNPYLNFSASLTLTADAVSRQVTDPQTASYLASHGFLGSYTVTMPTYSTSTVGSVLLITVSSGGTGGVEHTLNGVIGAVRTSLTKLQASGLPAGSSLSCWHQRSARHLTSRIPCARWPSSRGSACSWRSACRGWLMPRSDGICWPAVSPPTKTTGSSPVMTLPRTTSRPSGDSPACGIGSWQDGTTASRTVSGRP